jgi:phytoene dehydrogenase-like protein
MAESYDAIVIGAGHNGLVCAAYLARAGVRTLVLERRGVLGGACVTEEVWPGYRVSTASRYTAFDAKAIGTVYPTYVHIGPSIEYLERAYDDAKYGRLSARPFLSPVVPTILDPDLAPKGKHILNIFGGHAPYTLQGATWDQERERFADTVVDTLAAYAPNLKGAVIHRQILIPPDLEAVFGLPHGHIFHGELSADQLFFARPVPGYANYRSPIRGLYQCGSATHRGGGVMGVSGHNAAREILKDTRR